MTLDGFGRLTAMVKRVAEAHARTGMLPQMDAAIEHGADMLLHLQKAFPRASHIDMLMLCATIVPMVCGLLEERIAERIGEGPIEATPTAFMQKISWN